MNLPIGALYLFRFFPFARFYQLRLAILWHWKEVIPLFLPGDIFKFRKSEWKFIFFNNVISPSSQWMTGNGFGK